MGFRARPAVIALQRGDSKPAEDMLAAIEKERTDAAEKCFEVARACRNMREILK